MDTILLTNLFRARENFKILNSLIPSAENVKTNKNLHTDYYYFVICYVTSKMKQFLLHIGITMH